MRNWKKAFGVTAAVAMAAAAMVPTTVFAEEEETFKIGVIGPMTGDYAQYGTNVYNAAVLAAEDVNANGGFNGYQIEILDDGDDMALYDRRYHEVAAALADAAAKTLGWKGEKPMTYEEFVSMMERYQQERAALPPGTWSAQARAWCETGGILNDGRYGSQVTREELAQALYNLAGKGR